MMPPSLCHYSLEGEDRTRKQESCEDSLLGSESESCVGGEGRGELVVWLVKFKGMCKGQTAGSPESPGPANIQAK